MECIEVIKPGMFSTIQDLGRVDYQIYGVSSSGAMDTFSLRLANILVGNNEGDAGIEVTILGPKLKFLRDGIIAITGANLSPQINGQSIPLWKAMRILAGDVLQFGKNISGCRAYIAIAGGIDVPRIMGSRSTFLRGGFGGMEGRALKVGDILSSGISNIGNDFRERSMSYQCIPDYKQDRAVRFILGPQAEAFTEQSIKTFISQPYTILGQSDRMGYRLHGPVLAHNSGADIISDYIPVGSIQVAGDGQPIILMADCQMTGGYTKIGVVIGVDIAYLAQKKPGDQIVFEKIGIMEAQQLWKNQEKLMALLRINNHNMQF